MIIEFLVLGAAIKNRKREVTSEEVNNFRKTCNQPLEFGNELQFCEYSEEKDTYTIKDNIPPYILHALTNM